MRSALTPIRRRKTGTSQNGGGQPAVVGTFESRLLLFAVNDSASLSGTQTSVEIDVLANDTGTNKSVVSVGPRTSNTNGGMVSLNSNGKLTYSIYAAGIKTLADYTNSNNSAIADINRWHATEVGLIARYYDAINGTIDRFGAFLGNHASGIATLGGFVGAAVDLVGGYPKAAGMVVGFLASAHASNLGSSNAVIIAAAKQLASARMGVEIDLAGQWANDLLDNLALQNSYVPNPKTYGNDSFTYTINEMWWTVMPGMPGMLMPTYTQSSATVSISANITDYRAMVMNIDSWRSSTQSHLNFHKYSGNLDLNRMYGSTLLRYASSRGWSLIYADYSLFQTGNYWLSPYSPVIPNGQLDGQDVADELNAIGYTP